ncbi:MAG: MMPL family transporter [Actinomycetota bacterium]|nr:MMPL family transporter [Actinomycetota bacterium]
MLRQHPAFLGVVVVALWLAVALVTLPATLRLSSVETDRFSSLLPAGAPSTEALRLLRDVEGGHRSEALVVLRSVHRGLAAQAAATWRELEDAHVRGVTALSRPVISTDRMVAVLAATITGGEPTDLRVVQRLRVIASASSRVSPGVRVGVTGPAAFETDLLGSLAGVDTTLVVATALLVTVLLIVNYRSPVAWLLPLAAVGFAELLGNAATYLVAHVVVVTGESTGLLTVLVFGVGTDYALLLTSRYREELSRGRSDAAALALAWRRATPAIGASAVTVIAGLACLLLAKDGVTHGFALVGMLGVASTLVAMLTAYPAMLLAAGRRIFWPVVPGDPARPVPGRMWRAIGKGVVRHPKVVWMGGISVLALMALGITQLNIHVTTVNDLPGSAPSVEGMRLLSGGFPEGITAPAFVVVRTKIAVPAALRAARRSPGVLSVGRPTSRGKLSAFDVVFSAPPLGEGGIAPVLALRDRLERSVGPAALVGGQTAQDIDTARTSVRDFFVVGLAVLAVTVLVLGLLLRALAGPFLVAATVVASYGAVLGLVAALSGPVFHWPGIDPSVPVLGLVFLMSLGADYNFFLMSRAREELTRDEMGAVERAVAATGVVLSAAGLILAGTFAALLVSPLIPTREIGVVVAAGVLLDALFVRSVVLPALVADTGKRFWWPTRAGSR